MQEGETVGSRSTGAWRITGSALAVLDVVYLPGWSLDRGRSGGGDSRIASEPEAGGFPKCHKNNAIYIVFAGYEAGEFLRGNTNHAIYMVLAQLALLGLLKDDGKRSEML